MHNAHKLSTAPEALAIEGVWANSTTIFYETVDSYLKRMSSWEDTDASPVHRANMRQSRTRQEQMPAATRECRIRVTTWTQFCHVQQWRQSRCIIAAKCLLDWRSLAKRHTRSWEGHCIMFGCTGHVGVVRQDARRGCRGGLGVVGGHLLRQLVAPPTELRIARHMTTRVLLLGTLAVLWKAWKDGGKLTHDR